MNSSQPERMLGTPIALGTIVAAHADLAIVGMFRHGPEIQHSRGEFDYHDFDIDLSSPGPRSSGGVSGGGLWRVWLYRPNPDGQIDWKISLHGVAFTSSQSLTNAGLTAAMVAVASRLRSVTLMPPESPIA